MRRDNSNDSSDVDRTEFNFFSTEKTENLQQMNRNKQEDSYNLGKIKLIYFI